jgi:emfourin
MGVEVELERSGGFAGLSVRGSVSEEELSPAELEALVELVRRFEAAPPDPRQAAPDRFQYSLVLRQDGSERRITVFENMIEPEDLGLLVRLLERGRRLPGAAER